MPPWASTIEPYILIGVVLILAAIVASRISARLGVPALLLFLLVGMLAGSEGPGGIRFDDPAAAQAVGVVALSLILFAGGLQTEWRSVRRVFAPGVGLATLGVFGTAILLGVFASAVTPLTLVEALLLGSIVSSTDAAAVFMVLRSKSVSLKGELKPLLELESGSNDPMAVFLTLSFIYIITDPVNGGLAFSLLFLRQMVLGGAIGYFAGLAMVFIVNRLRLEYDGLYSVLTLALVLLTYSATALLGASGFLAVYLAGLVMGSRDFIHKRSLIRFHDGIAWLMQITMFVTLGLLVFPSHLLPVVGAGLAVAAFLMFAARPIAVFLILAFTRMTLAEKTLVSWVGLRGAVPIVLASFPVVAGIGPAETIFNIVFFIVITSALLQGSTIPWVARRLGVDAPMPGTGDEPTVLEVGECIICMLSEMEIPEGSRAAGRQIVEAAIPDDAQILLINRRGRTFTPTGSTVLRPADVLLVHADDDAAADLREALSPPGE